MGKAMGLFVGVIACGIVKRDHGRWYEYLAVVILTAIACFGFSII